MSDTDDDLPVTVAGASLKDYKAAVSIRSKIDPKHYLVLTVTGPGLPSEQSVYKCDIAHDAGSLRAYITQDMVKKLFNFFQDMYVEMRANALPAGVVMVGNSAHIAEESARIAPEQRFADQIIKAAFMGGASEDVSPAARERMIRNLVGDEFEPQVRVHTIDEELTEIKPVDSTEPSGPTNKETVK